MRPPGLSEQPFGASSRKTAGTCVTDTMLSLFVVMRLSYHAVNRKMSLVSLPIACYCISVISFPNLTLAHKNKYVKLADSEWI